MKSKIVLVGLVLGLGLASCEKCIKCTVVYTGETEEHVNDVCGEDVTMSDVETTYQGMEDSGTIESGWSCK